MWRSLLNYKLFFTAYTVRKFFATSQVHWTLTIITWLKKIGFFLHIFLSEIEVLKNKSTPFKQLTRSIN